MSLDSRHGRAVVGGSGSLRGGQQAEHPCSGDWGGGRLWQEAQYQCLGYTFPRNLCWSREYWPNGAGSSAGRMALGCRRLSQDDTVPRAATFSCIPCVPCNLPVRPEAAKAYAAPPSTCSSEVKELHLTKQPLIVPLWQMGMSKTNFQI